MSNNTDLTVSVESEDIEEIKRAKCFDEDNGLFAHLHVHDEYSVLDGISRIEELVIRAKKMGFNNIAQTNHGNIDGAIKFYNSCNKNEIKPIIGCELYIVENIKEKERIRYHILYLCKNEKGFHSLMKILTIANQEGFYYRPRIDKDILKENFDGNDAILSTACSSGVLNKKWGRELVKWCLYEYGKDSIFIELMPFSEKSNQEYFEMAFEFSKKYEMNNIITNDIHYLRKNDWFEHEALLAIGSKPFRSFSDKNRWKFGEELRGQLYLKSRNQIWKDCRKNLTFMNRKEVMSAMDNTLFVADLCKDFKLEKRAVTLPDIISGVRDYDKYIREVSYKRLKEFGLDKKKKYIKRFEYELERIERLGFSKLLILVADYVNYAKKNKILVGPGRGTSSGSLICYLLGITLIDPLRFDLLFDRFISEGRIDLPDIDIDFEKSNRYKINDYLSKKYGKDNCAYVTTMLTFRGRQALRDAARYMEVPLIEVDKVAKAIIKRSGGDARAEFTAKDSFDVFEESKEFAKKYPEATKIAIKLESRIKTLGIHAAGYVVNNESLRNGNNCVLVNRKKMTAINWDKHDMEYMGLLKLDILGLNTLSILKDTAELVNKRHNINIDWYKIDPEQEGCEKIYKEFALGHTVGVFQFSTKGLQKMCQDLKVKCFEDICVVNALFRPGTLRSGLSAHYIERAQGKQKIESVCDIYDEITKDTMGIVLYQEQIMFLIYKMAGMPWKTADTIRKVVSKSQGEEAFLKWKNDFVDGCVRKGTLKKEQASDMYDKLAEFGSYSFNKSHCYCYSWIGFTTMWAKINYPSEYLCSILNNCAVDKFNITIKEALRMNIKIKPPDIRYSSHKWELNKEGDIVAPLTCIKFIGSKAVEKFVKERDNIIKEFGYLFKNKK